MQAALAALAFAGTLWAQVAEKRVVVLPLAPVEVEDARAVEAWERTFSRLEREGRRAGLSFERHRVGRRALYNTRAQIWACETKPGCSMAYARSLGAHWVVSGQLRPGAVRLELYDVDAERLLLAVESSPDLGTKGAEAQVEAAVRGLLEELPTARAAGAEARAEAATGGTP